MPLDASAPDRKTRVAAILMRVIERSTRPIRAL